MRATILFALLISAPAFATMTVEKVDCPEQFEGRVQEIIESIGPTSAYSTQTVVFKNLHTLKGDVSEQVAIEVLKHGPISFEQGEDYQVQVRNGRICWIEKI